MGVHLDPAEFIAAVPAGPGGGTALIWSPLPPPEAGELTPRGQTWERGRYLAYQERLASRSVTRTFALAARFLRLAAVPLPGLVTTAPGEVLRATGEPALPSPPAPPPSVPPTTPEDGG
jgi:hypothetical protein